MTDFNKLSKLYAEIRKNEHIKQQQNTIKCLLNYVKNYWRSCNHTLLNRIHIWKTYYVLRKRFFFFFKERLILHLCVSILQWSGKTNFTVLKVCTNIRIEIYVGPRSAFSLCSTPHFKCAVEIDVAKIRSMKSPTVGENTAPLKLYELHCNHASALLLPYNKEHL